MPNNIMQYHNAGRLSTKRELRVNDGLRPDVVTELERLRLEQAKTNELLRQILVPLTFISGCCSALLSHVQRLAASCSTAVVLLEDCSRALYAVRLHVGCIAALLSAAAAAAARGGLLDEHAAHAGRGMHIAAAACLLAGATLRLPYRWRACSTPQQLPADGDWLPGVPVVGLERSRTTSGGAAAGAFGLADLIGAVKAAWRGGGGVSTAAAPSRAWWRNSPVLFSIWVGPGPGSRHRASPSPGGAEVALGRSGAAAASWWTSAWGSGSSGGSSCSSGGRSCFSGSSSSNIGGGGPSTGRWWWLWQYWYGSARGASVLVCRTRVAGGFLVAASVLVLWSAAWCYWTAVRRLQAGTASGVGPSASGVSGSLPLQLPLAPSQRSQRLMQPLALFGYPAAASYRTAAAMYDGAMWSGRVGPTCALALSMWRSSARLVVVHSPAWVAALGAMGGSPVAWLVLQLMWHAVLPYAVVALVVVDGAPAGVTTSKDVTLGASAVADSVRHDQCKSYGGQLRRQDVADATAVTVAAGGTGTGQSAAACAATRGSEPEPQRRRDNNVACAATADACDLTSVVSDVAEEEGSATGDTDCCGREHRASSGLRHRALGGGGIFGLKLRFRSAVKKKPGCKVEQPKTSEIGPASKSETAAGFRRSQQLAAVTRHGSTPVVCATAGAAAAAAGPGSRAATAAATVDRATSSAATATELGPSAAEGFRGALLLPQRGRPPPVAVTPIQEKLARRASHSSPAPELGRVRLASVTAAARWARPLLAALWLYGGPVLLGVVPVLPGRWFRSLAVAAVPALLLTYLALVAGTVVVVFARAPRSAAAGTHAGEGAGGAAAGSRRSFRVWARSEADGL